MSSTPSPAPRQPEVIELSGDAWQQGITSGKELLDLPAIVRGLIARHEEINRLLRQDGVNRHDLPHTLRSAGFAAELAKAMGLDRHAIARILAGGIPHDIGYRKREFKKGAIPKEFYRKHAAHGAEEMRDFLHFLLDALQNPGTNISDSKQHQSLRRLLSFRNETGVEQLLDENDIAAIEQIIRFHNDYGVDEAADYDPRKIERLALFVQLFDKLDQGHLRTDKEHLKPEKFPPELTSFNIDQIHRSVPCCITDYHFRVHPHTGQMEATYVVDLNRFARESGNEGFNYSEDLFVRHFQGAYGKSMRVAAEAIGTICNRDIQTNTSPNLLVTLDFGSSQQQLEFARPDRAIYQQNPPVASAEVTPMAA